MAVVQTSSYVTTPDASQVGLCVIVMMIVATTQMNTVIARSQLAAPMSLLALTNAVF